MLTIQNLTLTRNKQCIINDLSLQLMPGEFWGLVGFNGRGKTTLLNSLAGLYPVSSGHILIKNEPLADIPRKHIAKQLGLLLQEENPLFPLTTRQAILLGSYAKTSSIKPVDLLATLLTEFDLWPVADRNILTLSLGQRRRISIARLCLQSPDIYLLDEPTNHLDLYYQHKIFQLMKYRCQHQAVTVLLASHQLNLIAQYCDRVLILMPDGSSQAQKARDVFALIST